MYSKAFIFAVLPCCPAPAGILLTTSLERLVSVGLGAEKVGNGMGRRNVGVMRATGMVHWF